MYFQSDLSYYLFNVMWAVRRGEPSSAPALTFKCPSGLCAWWGTTGMEPCRSEE